MYVGQSDGSVAALNASTLVPVWSTLLTAPPNASVVGAPSVRGPEYSPIPPMAEWPPSTLRAAQGCGRIRSSPTQPWTRRRWRTESLT